jgi:hypothetical protein
MTGNRNQVNLLKLDIERFVKSLTVPEPFPVAPLVDIWLGLLETSTPFVN